MRTVHKQHTHLLCSLMLALAFLADCGGDSGPDQIPGTDAGVSFLTSGNVKLVTLDGRAMSLNASVTMVNTIINVPAQ